jgi:uncharacterized cupredoxin-like copper-binding protein
MRLRRLFPAVALVPVVLAGCGSDDAPGGTSAAGSAVLDVEATEMKFIPQDLRVAPGTVTVVLRNSGVILHDFRLEGMPNVLVEAKPGETSRGSWALRAGAYVVYCSLPGHRQAGMVASLVVA